MENRIFTIAQLVLAGIAFAGVVTLIIAHLVMGNFGPEGFMVGMMVLLLVYWLVKLAYKEYKQEKEK